MSTCQSCSSTAVDGTELRWPVFRHLDFTDVASTGGLIACRACGAVAAADFNRVAAVHRGFLFEAKYLAAAPTAHVIHGQSSGDTRPARQAAWITKHLETSGITCPSILDVGCFDGALLKELSARWPAARLLAGHDPNPALAPFFPQKPPFEFHATCNSLVGASFDVIMASHSLMYDRQLPTTLATLAKLLATNGLLIMVMPNIAHNTPYLLMGDQYWFGSPRYLIGLFHQQGLSVRRGLSEDWGHDLVLLASVSDGKPPLDSTPPDRPASQPVSAMLASLERSAAAINALHRDDRGYHVLGRTANAAFAASVLGERCIGFIDEAIEPGKISSFRNLPAVHPSQLTSRSNSNGIVLCYGDRNVAISRRLHRYGARIFYA